MRCALDSAVLDKEVSQASAPVGGVWWSPRGSCLQRGSAVSTPDLRAICQPTLELPSTSVCKGGPPLSLHELYCCRQTLSTLSSLLSVTTIPGKFSATSCMWSSLGQRITRNEWLRKNVALAFHKLRRFDGIQEWTSFRTSSQGRRRRLTIRLCVHVAAGGLVSLVEDSHWPQG